MADKFQITESDAELIKRLVPDHQAILAASGGSYDEIAADLSLNVGTVKSRLNRARKALVKLRDAQVEQQQQKAA